MTPVARLFRRHLQVTAAPRDLASGAWDERFGHLRDQPAYEGSLVVIRAV